MIIQGVTLTGTYIVDELDIVRGNLQLYLDPLAYSGSGTDWIDSSTNGYTTTLVGSPTYNTTYFNYPNTTARYIDTNQSLAAQLFSVGLWFRTTAAGIKMTLCKETTAGWPWNYRIWLNGGQISGDVANSSGAYESVASTLTNYNNGSWYYVMFTRDASTLRLYVNGLEIKNSATVLVGSITNSQELWIGRSAYAGAYQWVGDMGEIFVYDRTLTATEILQNYTATKSGYGL